jgi:[ribosomal protein S5]-alanine N-acetyltransferase
VVAVKPVPNDAFLVGERVYLRALRDEDADGPYAGWFNDEETCRGNSHHQFPYTKHAALDYIRAVRSRRDCLVLAIALRSDDRHVGNISLQAIDGTYRSAELAFVIGEPDARGKGYGREAGRLVVGHGFRALNLHRIYCGTFETNEAMRRLAKDLGMREEGRRRDAAFKDGRFVDLIEFGVLESEFESA